MEKFIPYEKLSKKKKKELDSRRRKDWGAISPVTRRAKDPKAYRREKLKLRGGWQDGGPGGVAFYAI